MRLIAALLIALTLVTPAHAWYRGGNYGGWGRGPNWGWGGGYYARPYYGGGWGNAGAAAGIGLGLGLLGGALAAQQYRPYYSAPCNPYYYACDYYGY